MAESEREPNPQPQPRIDVPANAPPGPGRPGSERAPYTGNPANPLDQMKTLDQFLKRFPHLAELLHGPADARDRRTVAEVINLYLVDAQTADLSPMLLDNRTRTLKLFARELGSKLVSECLSTDLKRFIQAHADQWQSAWTRKRVSIDVQRCFNWAADEARVIRANPFRGVHYAKGDSRRAMTEQEFRGLLRCAPAYLRRFLFAMLWTGCRPSELSRLEWSMIDWQRGIAILKKHKISKKTRKPRVIVLVPAMIRLLRWLERHRGYPAAVALRRILADGPVKIKEVVRRMAEHGYSCRSLYKARLRLGARYRTVKADLEKSKGVYWSLPAGLTEDPARPWSPAAKTLKGILARGPVWSLEVGERMTALGFSLKAMYAAQRALGVEGRIRTLAKTYQVMELPEATAAAPTGEGDCERFVFLNAYGGQWDRHSLSHHIARLRQRAGIADDCTLYGLRHKFGTDGVRAGVNLHVLSKLLGHSDISTTSENYVHIDNDYELLQGAAEQIRTLLTGKEGEKGEKGGAH